MSRTLYLNFAHKNFGPGHLLENLQFICWRPTTNCRDNHKLEIFYKFFTKYCFFDSEKGFKWTSIGSLHTSGNRSYQLHLFCFLQTRFVQLRSNFTHTQPTPYTDTTTHHTLTHKQMYTSTPEPIFTSTTRGRLFYGLFGRCHGECGLVVRNGDG